MKYGYHFYDWNLFDVVELHEVRDLDQDIEARGHLFTKDEWVIAKVYTNVISPFPTLKRDEDLGYWVLVPRKHVFDSREAAEAFGKEDSACIFDYEIH